MNRSSHCLGGHEQISGQDPVRKGDNEAVPLAVSYSGSSPGLNLLTRSSLPNTIAASVAITVAEFFPGSLFAPVGLCGRAKSVSKLMVRFLGNGSWYQVVPCRAPRGSFVVWFWVSVYWRINFPGRGWADCCPCILVGLIVATGISWLVILRPSREEVALHEE